MKTINLTDEQYILLIAMIDRVSDYDSVADVLYETSSKILNIDTDNENDKVDREILLLIDSMYDALLSKLN